MQSTFTNRSFYLMLGIDSLCFVLALLLSILISFDFFSPSAHWHSFLSILPWAVSVKLALFYVFGLYKGRWRVASLSDIWRLVQACFLAEATVVALLALVHRFEHSLREVFVWDAVLTLILTGGLRMLVGFSYGPNTPGDNKDLEDDPLGFLDVTPHPADRSSYDLLDRRRVEVDEAAIAQCVHNKVVLISGAGGIVGSELVRQVAGFAPALLILVDWGEDALYAMEMELWEEMGFDRYLAVLGDVHDDQLISQIFSQYLPQVVIQAAGSTNAALLEENPWVAVEGNILSSQVLMRAAADYKAERFVLVSTDLAANPDTVLGASKRTAEMLMQAMSRGRTVFMAVRFGRILDGYMPFFQRQISKGGPVSVPHPEMTCSSLPAREVARLILQAMALGQGGEIFALPMNDQVRIADMAREMIHLSGREPDVDIDVQYTGLEFGEQISGRAELAEWAEATDHSEIMVLRPDKYPNLQNKGRHSRLPDLVLGLKQVAERLDGPAIVARLRDIVPEYAGSDKLTVLQVREKRKLRLRVVKKREGGT